MFAEGVAKGWTGHGLNSNCIELLHVDQVENPSVWNTSEKCEARALDRRIFYSEGSVPPVSLPRHGSHELGQLVKSDSKVSRNSSHTAQAQPITSTRLFQA